MGDKTYLAGDIGLWPIGSAAVLGPQINLALAIANHTKMKKGSATS